MILQEQAAKKLPSVGSFKPDKSFAGSRQALDRPSANLGWWLPIDPAIEGAL